MAPRDVSACGPRSVVAIDRRVVQPTSLEVVTVVVGEGEQERGADAVLAVVGIEHRDVRRQGLHEGQVHRLRIRMGTRMDDRHVDQERVEMMTVLVWR